ncbi:MAG: hypothetical protein ACOYL5_03335 [Phototrophicaceae bacterium]|jgi:hypothetical protein
MLLIVGLLVLIGLLLLGLALRGRPLPPWSGQVVQVKHSMLTKPEWMAPEHVCKQVAHAYQEALHWLQDAPLMGVAAQQAQIGMYLDGELLQQHQAQFAYNERNLPRFIGILRVAHFIQVRQFSEHGEQCLVIDYQTERRMATYHTADHRRVTTQALADAYVIYQMRYDADAARWKIARFVQELNVATYLYQKQPYPLPEFTLYSKPIGRDN